MPSFVLFKLKFYFIPYGALGVALSTLLDLQAARRGRFERSVVIGIVVVVVGGYFGRRLIARQRESLWSSARAPIVEVIGGLELARLSSFDMIAYSRFLLEPDDDGRLVLRSEDSVRPVTADGWDVVLFLTRRGRAMCCEFHCTQQVIRCNALRFQGMTSDIAER